MDQFKENRFYGRRKGKKLKPSREVLLDAFLPKISISTLNTNGQVDPKAYFPFTPKEVWLEVGFGGGEHLAEQSLRFKDIGFIGAEVYLNGVTSLLTHLTGTIGKGDLSEETISFAENRVDNVRIYNDDVRDLLPCFQDASFDRIYVLFPDPWPKYKHRDRRFIGPKNIPILARLLKPKGILRVASDDMTYISHALEHMLDSKDFVWTAKNANDWKSPPADWVKTRYEQKALTQGKKPVYLTFERL